MVCCAVLSAGVRASALLATRHGGAELSEAERRPRPVKRRPRSVRRSTRAPSPCPRTSPRTPICSSRWLPPPPKPDRAPEFGPQPPLIAPLRSSPPLLSLTHSLTTPSAPSRQVLVKGNEQLEREREERRSQGWSTGFGEPGTAGGGDGGGDDGGLPSAARFSFRVAFGAEEGAWRISQMRRVENVQVGRE